MLCETARACRCGRPPAQLVEPTSPLSSRAAGRAAASAWPVLHWSCQARATPLVVAQARALRPGGVARLHGAFPEIDLHFAARPSTSSHPRYGIRQGATESSALKVTRGAPRVRRCRRHCPARRTAAGASPQCCSQPRQGGSGWPAPVPRPLQNGHGRSRAPAAAMQQPQPLALRHRGQWKRACCKSRRRDGFTPSPQPVAPPCSQFRVFVLSSIPLPCPAPCQRRPNPTAPPRLRLDDPALEAAWWQGQSTAALPSDIAGCLLSLLLAVRPVCLTAPLNGWLVNARAA
jgi:hypothetical protein